MKEGVWDPPEHEATGADTDDRSSRRRQDDWRLVVKAPTGVVLIEGFCQVNPAFGSPFRCSSNASP